MQVICTDFPVPGTETFAGQNSSVSGTRHREGLEATLCWEARFSRVSQIRSYSWANI